MIDLHTHSTCSDGTLTPAELIALAEETGLTAVALCDHNTVDGLPAFLTAGECSPVEAVPGVEFSTDYGETELHILGLMIPSRHWGEVSALLAQAVARKEESNLDLIAGLKAAGLALDYDRIKASMDGGVVNRAVIAAEMTRLGYTSSVKEAFRRWLEPEHGYFHPPRRLDCFEVIRFIKSVGGAAVLAHPFLNLKEEGALREFLIRGKEAGLDGMETRYPKFTGEQSRRAAEIARELGLLESGGSDFHGANKPDIALGVGRGDLRVPEEFLEQLKTRAEFR